MTDTPTRIAEALKTTPIAISTGAHPQPLTLRDILLDHCFLRDGPMARDKLGFLDEAVDSLLSEIAHIAVKASEPSAVEPETAAAPEAGDAD